MQRNAWLDEEGRVAHSPRPSVVHESVTDNLGRCEGLVRPAPECRFTWQKELRVECGDPRKSGHPLLVSGLDYRGVVISVDMEECPLRIESLDCCTWREAPRTGAVLVQNNGFCEFV